MGVGRDHDHVAPAYALHRVVRGKRFDQQAAGTQIGAAIADGQAVQPGIAGEFRQNGADLGEQGGTVDQAHAAERANSIIRARNC